MPDQEPDTSPASLSGSIYPQPTTTAGRGQSYSRTTIELGPLPVERAVPTIPWGKLLLTSGFAAFTISAVDWGIGIWAGSDEGDLQLAVIGPFVVMVIIAALGWTFYRAVVTLLNQAGVSYVRGIIWSTILFILPATQGLRWLIMPELVTRRMPIFSHGITYVIATTFVWMGAIALITYLLIQPKASKHRHHRTAMWMVVTPYLIAVPIGVIALVKAMNLLP